jgi:hypothetical protein
MNGNASNGGSSDVSSDGDLMVADVKAGGQLKIEYEIIQSNTVIR